MERPTVTLHELQTIYGVEDLYNLLEIGAVNAHNARVVAKIQERRQKEAMRAMQGG